MAMTSTPTLRSALTIEYVDYIRPIKDYYDYFHMLAL